jgi:hypothetical protein
MPSCEDPLDGAWLKKPCRKTSIFQKGHAAKRGFPGDPRPGKGHPDRPKSGNDALDE